MDERFLRTIGAATAAYGLAITARPEWLARPAGLTDEEGRVAADTAAVLRPLAWRDIASGVAMAAAPAGPALRTAAAVRIAADAGDALLLGAALRGDERRKAVGVAVGWGALAAAALWRSSRRR